MSSGPFDRRLVNGIGALVALIWAVSFVADVLNPLYDPSPYIHLAMMAVVGAAVGAGFVRKNGNGNGSGS